MKISALALKITKALKHFSRMYKPLHMSLDREEYDCYCSGPCELCFHRK